MARYWFRPRQYGYGATPVTWEGWAITLAAVVVVVTASLIIPAVAGRSLWGLGAGVIDGLAVAALLIVSRRKTAGEWRWRWGQET